MKAKKNTGGDGKKEGRTRSLIGKTGKQISCSPKSSPAPAGSMEKALKERIKELNCFFGISTVMELPEITLDEILEKIVLLLPPAWQFPEIAEACIVLEEKTFPTAHFQRTSRMLAQVIMVNGYPAGQIMVCYREEPPANHEDPFMAEERHLLNAIAERLGHIIERKRAEKALNESEGKFRGIFNTINDGIHIHEIRPDGTPGKFIEVNEVACRMLQYTRDELLEHGPLEFVTGYHSRPFSEIIGELSSTGHAIFETEHRRKDGTIMPVEVNTHVVTLQGKRVMVSVVRDITERRQAESALLQANKKFNLLSNITRHDINNQISAIVMFLYLAKEEVADPAIQEHLRKIEQATQLIQNQIWFMGEYETIGITVPAWQDIRALADLTAKQAPQGNVMVKNDIPAGRELFADPLIANVFFNLVDNAVRYGRKIATIRFSLEERDGDHVIVCEDDGDGIPADDKEKIFERGFGKNTGLGLALARELLDITGITIRETGEPGRGARFEMTVPKGAYRFSGIE
jgi:PAS domain S-box-containing protein